MTGAAASMLPGLEVPFDHEMALLRSGARRLVKREFADQGAIEGLRAEGWHVAVASEVYGIETASPDIRVGEGREVTAFVGTREDTGDAMDLERAERHGHGEERRRAIHGLGALLGYPPCCTEVFATQPDQGERASIARLLGEGPHGSLPPANNFFVLSQQLISHFPCRLDCKASARVGMGALHLLAKADRTAADALVALLRSPITVWDRYRFVVDHVTEGPITGARLTNEARLFGYAPFLAFEDALPKVPDGGTRLAFDGDLRW